MKTDLNRPGAVCVELAITLPVVIAIAFAAIEIFNMISIRQTAFRVAFDTARVVSQDDLPNADAMAFAQHKLSEIELSGEISIQVNPSSEPGFEQVTINIDAKPDNKFSIARITRGMLATGTATALRRIDPGSNSTRPGKIKKGRGRGGVKK